MKVEVEDKLVLDDITVAVEVAGWVVELDVVARVVEVEGSVVVLELAEEVPEDVVADDKAVVVVTV